MANINVDVKEKQVGEIVGYYSSRGLAKVKITGDVSKGEMVRIERNGPDLHQEYNPVAKESGRSILINVEKPVKEGDKVFALKAGMDIEVEKGGSGGGLKKKHEGEKTKNHAGMEKPHRSEKKKSRCP